MDFSKLYIGGQWVDSASGRDPSPDRRSTATHDDGTDAASEQGDPDGVVADRVDDTEDWARALVDPQAPAALQLVAARRQEPRDVA